MLEMVFVHFPEWPSCFFGCVLEFLAYLNGQPVPLMMLILFHIMLIMVVLMLMQLEPAQGIDLSLVTTRLLHQLIDKDVQAMWLMSCNSSSVGDCQGLDFELCNYQANWLLLLWHCWNCKSLWFLQYGFLRFWYCWGLPGLLFSSQWAFDIFTLLGACQELGFELLLFQANGLLIKSNVFFAVAPLKHSCFRNFTCTWYHCIIQDQSA